MGVCSPERLVAVISPADQLLGREIALALAQRCFDVALIGEDEVILREIALSVLRVGGRVLAVEASIGSSESVSAGIREICNRLGPVDVWVGLDADCCGVDRGNSQGFPCVCSIDAGIFGWGLLDAVAVMSERHCGTVVSVQSTMAFIPSAARPELCAAAFARRGLLASLRRKALTSGGAVRFCSVVASLPVSGSADVEGVARQARLIARAVSRSAVDGRRQRVVSLRSRGALVVARLFPATLDHWSESGSPGEAHALDRSLWPEARGAVRARWAEVVRGWRSSARSSA